MELYFIVDYDSERVCRWGVMELYFIVDYDSERVCRWGVMELYFIVDYDSERVCRWGVYLNSVRLIVVWLGLGSAAAWRHSAFIK